MCVWPLPFKALYNDDGNKLSANVSKAEVISWLRDSARVSGSLALGGGLSYAYHIAVGRLLGPEVYGTFGALLGVFYLLWIYSQSVQLRLARAASLSPLNFHQALRSVLPLGLGIAVFLALWSPWLAAWLKLPIWGLLGVALVWLTTLPLPAVKGLLQGRQRFTQLAVLNVLEPTLKLTLGVSLIVLGSGLIGAWAAWSLAALLTLPFALRGLFRNPLPQASAIREIPSAGLSLALPAAFVLAIPTNVDVLAAKGAFSAEQAGLYVAAAVLGKGFLFLALGVGAVLLPRSAGATSAAVSSRHLRQALQIALGVGGFGVLLCLVLPQSIVYSLFGKAYAGSVPLIRFYAPAMLIFMGVVMLIMHALAQSQKLVLWGLAALSALEALMLFIWTPHMPQELTMFFLSAQAALLGLGTLLFFFELQRKRAQREVRKSRLITLVAPYPSPGEKHGTQSGVASYTCNLAKGLKRMGLEVNVIAQKISGSSLDPLERGEEPYVMYCWTPGSPRFVWEIMQAIHRLRPALIHVQHELFLFGGVLTVGLAPLLLWLLRLSTRAKLVVTLHGVPPLSRLDQEFIRENGLKGLPWLLHIALFGLLRSIVTAAHCVIVHEELFRKRLLREYRCPADKITVIHHGIETPDERSLPCSEEAKQALGVAGKRTVLFLGYLTGYKGVEVLLEGFVRAAPAHPDWVLLLAGGPHPRRWKEPAYQHYLLNLESQLKRLRPQAEYLGFVPEEKLPLVFRAADVVVFPYRVVLASSGPLALCLAFDRPFLASEAFRGVLPEELLFTLDPEAVRTTLETFFRSSWLAERACRLARTWRTERSWESVAQKTQALYQRLLQGQQVDDPLVERKEVCSWPAPVARREPR